MPVFFFFNDTATTEIYTLSLHDALPIFIVDEASMVHLEMMAALLEALPAGARLVLLGDKDQLDRKSTRLNSSHSQISYAVFCLKKKKTLSSRETRHDRLQPHATRIRCTT